jgi:hypothetical protein
MKFQNKRSRTKKTIVEGRILFHTECRTSLQELVSQMVARPSSLNSGEDTDDETASENEDVKTIETQVRGAASLRRDVV